MDWNTISISVHRASPLLSLRTVFCSPCHFSSLGSTRNSSALPAVSFAILGQRMFEVLCFPAQCTAQPCWPRCRAAARAGQRRQPPAAPRQGTARHGTAQHTMRHGPRCRKTFPSTSAAAGPRGKDKCYIPPVCSLFPISFPVFLYVVFILIFKWKQVFTQLFKATRPPSGLYCTSSPIVLPWANF